MSCVFQNIDPPPPSPPGECVPLCCGGRTQSPGGEGGGGSIFWKTQDTALYFTYIESSLGVLMTNKITSLFPELALHLCGRPSREMDD
jgi:hypothetical protein